MAALELEPAGDAAQSEGLKAGESLQKIVRFDLKEEGNHILAVSVSYTETRIGQDSQAASGRVRTFRKLYQFVAQPCLSVRTKASELPPLEVENKSLGPYGKTRLLRFALEAQLENVGDGAVVVKVGFPRLGFGATCMLGANIQTKTLHPANSTESQTTVQITIPKLGRHRPGYFIGVAANTQPARCSAGCISSGAGRRSTGGPGSSPERSTARRPRYARPVVD